MAARATGKLSYAALLPWGLLAVCLGLGWLIYQELGASPAPQTATAAGTGQPLPEPPEAVPFVMPPAETFVAVVERPLFSPTRRMPSEATPAIVQTKDPIDLELKGVIGSQDQRIAIFLPKTPSSKNDRSRRARERGARPPPSTSASLQLSEGDTYRDWTLEQIELDAALFVRGEEEAWLEMKFDVAVPVQREPPRRRQTAKRRQRASNDGGEEDDEEHWNATPDERDWIEGVLEGEGCSGAHKMVWDNGLYVVENVLCMDGRTYRIKLDDEYEIVAKELYD
jgi:hypothetical protein